jgi:hypothetical protein
MNGDQIPEDHQSNAQPPASSPNAHPVDPPTASEHLNATEEAIEERMSTFERSTVRLTRVSIVVAVVVGLAVIAQWWEMHTSGVDTHALAGATEKQADAASKSAQAARDFADTAALIKGGIESAVNKLDQQSKASRDLATLTRNQFALAQRPWVQVDTAIAIHQPEVWVGNDSSGNPIHRQPSELMKLPNQMILGDFHTDFTATFRNVGLSPAVNEWDIVHMKFVDLPHQTDVGYTNVVMPKTDLCLPRSIAPKTKFVAFPGFPYSFKTSQLASNADIEGWVNLKKILVVYGCIKYDDELGKAHQTDFCSILDRLQNPVQWRSCPTGNTAW